MNTVLVVIISAYILFITSSHVFAQETGSSTTQVRYTNEFKTANEPSSIISLLKNFVDGFDSFLGGFIFNTPDPLAEVITLKDNSTIPGLSKYRNLFHQIAIPTIAILISGIAVTKIGTESTYELKNFGLRLVTVIGLFIIVPSVLSYSIQFNNLLVNQISTTAEFTGFLNNYFDKSEEAIARRENPEQFGIPSFEVSNEGGVFRSLGKFIVQIFLFAITFIFLLCGFLYIGYQFVIRFATLLFLGVIYPIVLPFALYERTQGIVQTFFKTWFTFLIQQPAFVLGFSIATDIFTSLLEAKGPSVGMLFFYTGFLFFLGGVNVLVAELFGNVWSMISGNVLATYSAKTLSSPVTNRIGEFKQGLLGKSLSTMLGNKTKAYLLSKTTKADEEPASIEKLLGSSTGGYKTKYKHSNGSSNLTATDPKFSASLAKKGFAVEQDNQKLGTVALSGTAYKYEDKQTGLVTYYPSVSEAFYDGVHQSKLQPVELKKSSFIDLSQFNKKHPNPHNLNVMQESQRLGRKVGYAYLTRSSPPQKVKNFLQIAQPRNKSLGIEGVIIERQATNGTYSIIRLYSHSDYEKH